MEEFKMDKFKVEMYLNIHGDKFPKNQLEQVRKKLERMDVHTYNNIQRVQIKDPMLMLLVSLIGGTCGIDRFVLGETGVGIAKLLTLGGCGIWAIVDWFLIQDKTRQTNFENFMDATFH